MGVYVLITERQKQARFFRDQGLSQRQIAEKMGVSRRAVRNLLSRVEDHEIDPTLQEVMENFGSTQAPELYWAKDKKFSALFKPKKVSQEDLLEKLQRAFQDIPAAPVIPSPVSVDQDLMAVYPLFDVHLELLAAANISGQETNLEIACERLKRNLSEVMARTKPAVKGVIVNGGDFNHTDDDLNLTPKHKHPLDSSARNYTTVDASVEILSALVEMALAKHETVEYYSVPGNHDPKNWVTIMMALYNRYRDNPRVTIEKNPLEFSVVTFGTTLIIIHHGDKRAVKDLILWFAAEYPTIWSGSNFRYLWTGHNHHLKAEDFPGITWEQHRPITSRDHHAFSNFYASMSEMKSVLFHISKGQRTQEREAL